MNSITPNLLEKFSQEFIFHVLSLEQTMFIHLSPKLFPATCLSLGSLRGGVLLTQGRPPPSPGRSLTSFRGGFAFIIYG